MNRISRIFYRGAAAVSVLWVLIVVAFLFAGAGGDLERLANEPALTFIAAAIYAAVPPIALFALVWVILWILRLPGPN